MSEHDEQETKEVTTYRTTAEEQKQRDVTVWPSRNQRAHPWEPRPTCVLPRRRGAVLAGGRGRPLVPLAGHAGAATDATPFLPGTQFNHPWIFRFW